jgi:hypothetical protein
VEIARLCRDQHWRLATWDIDRGLRLPEQPAAPATGEGGDPLAALHALPALATPEGTAVLVLVNFHRFLGSAEVVQALAHQISAGKHSRTFILILAPLVQIPAELDKAILVLEHDLPNREQLAAIARGIATEPGELPEGEQLEALLDAAWGLTRNEAENAFSLSLVRHQRVTPESLWVLKTQALKKSGLVSLHRSPVTFADLGGLQALKEFCRRALSAHRVNPAVKPRGILLVGVPGTGKSMLARALGDETQRPTLILDLGTLFGSLVGQTEANVRQALRLVEAMAPCVCFLDEIEKALSGAASANPGDSGVTGWLYGHFLTWLSDHQADVFTIATSNDVSRLPPEFLRAERFDALYFLDLPTAGERHLIWQQYRQQYEIPAGQPQPEDAGWTGAEIRSCCRLAALLDLPLTQAARNVVPVAVTAAEAVDKLRTWASGRCLSASEPGFFQRPGTSPGGPVRKVSRNPSSN